MHGMRVKTHKYVTTKAQNAQSKFSKASPTFWSSNVSPFSGRKNPAAAPAADAQKTSPKKQVKKSRARRTK